jgi:hypothetical protein
MQAFFNRYNFKNIENKGNKHVSFGLRGVLFRLGSKLFRFCLRGGIVRCICAVVRIRRSLYSTNFFRLH